MASPRIVGEWKRHIPELMPPATTRAHQWLSDASAQRFDEMVSSGGVFDVYLTSSAERSITEQATEAAPMRLEVMGLLLGEVRSWNGKLYTVVRDVGTTDLKNSPATVKFDPDALSDLFADLDSMSFDYVVVGWYHSHPGHTCFMSKTDLGTQRSMFSKPYHCALVIDPLNKEIEAFKIHGEGYVCVPFAIADGSIARLRRLKNGPSTRLPTTGLSV